MSEWYYAHDGQQKGPVPTSELERLAASGEFDPEQDLVWREGMEDWKPAVTVEELGFGKPAEPAPPTAEAPGAAESVSPAQQPAPASPAPANPAAAAPSSGMAIGALVCGILGLLLCVAPYFGVFVAIAAIVLGHIAKTRMKRDPAAYGGGGMATVGLVLGYLGALLCVLTLGFLFWAMTLTPEKVEQLEWMPEESRQQILEALEQQERMQEEQGTGQP